MNLRSYRPTLLMGPKKADVPQICQLSKTQKEVMPFAVVARKLAFSF